MAINGTERTSIHSLKGIRPKESEGFAQIAKTNPRTGDNVQKNSRSDLSLKGSIPEKYLDNPPT